MQGKDGSVRDKMIKWLEYHNLTRRKVSLMFGMNSDFLASTFSRNSYYLGVLYKICEFTNCKIVIYDMDDKEIVRLTENDSDIVEALCNYYRMTKKDVDLMMGMKVSYTSQCTKRNRMKIDIILAFAKHFRCKAKIISNVTDEVIVEFDENDYMVK